MSSTPAEVGRPLSRDFFARATVELAQALLRMLVVREGEGWQAVGRIVETEAYRGPQDQASHARAGLTPRTAPMFGEVGHAYVYLVYGMHSCLNVVGYAGQPAGAVLLRALEPVAGVSQDAVAPQPAARGGGPAVRRPGKAVPGPRHRPAF